MGQAVRHEVESGLLWAAMSALVYGARLRPPRRRRVYPTSRKVRPSCFQPVWASLSGDLMVSGSHATLQQDMQAAQPNHLRSGDGCFCRSRSPAPDDRFRFTTYGAKGLDLGFRDGHLLRYRRICRCAVLCGLYAQYFDRSRAVLSGRSWAYQLLYPRYLPVISTLTRSPLGFSTRDTDISKSIADMMPSPNFS